MDYTKLVTALKDGTSKELDSLYEETFDILCSYLRTNMRANEPDAKDCAQHALVKTLERIQKNAIREPESIYSYLLQSARNRYLRVRYEHNRSNYQEDMEAYVPVEEQIDILSTREEQDALENCLDQLNGKSRNLIEYLLEHPDSQARDVAVRFGISVNNVWTKKHRIIKILSDCIQSKLQK